MTHGTNIRNIRKQKNINQFRLAEKSGISVKALNVIELYNKDCMLSTLYKIADVLNIEVKELL